MKKGWSQVLRGRRVFVAIAAIVVLYIIFTLGISTNPPGFYMDEACLAYNGYLIAHTGMSEAGTSFPLYFQCYTEPLVQYANPTHIYLLAAMYLFVPASNVSARLLAATMVFIAALLLGLLAARIANRRMIGVIVAVTAVATPWLFEVSRLALETFFYPLCIVLFLLCLYNAHLRERWKLFDNIFLAVTLALITYSYSIGRLLGPGLAFGLLIFAVDRRALLSVVKTWVMYAITLIPLIYVYLTNNEALTLRFRAITYISADKSVWTIATEFVSNFCQDLSPRFLLIDGDPVGRHHVPVMGEIFAATFVLMILGLILVIWRHRGNPWWRFVLYGAVISILPGAITSDRHHSLRLLALPIFLLILTVPALAWLVGDVKKTGEQKTSPVPVGILTTSYSLFASRIILAVLMILTLAQAIYFQIKFQKWGPDRETAFNAAYPVVLDRALAEPDRPIYLQDGYYGPGYILAFWYATVRGLPLSNFYHLLQGERPPPGSLVLGSDQKCSDCNVILQKDIFILYKKVEHVDDGNPPSAVEPGVDTRIKPAVVFGSNGTEPGKFSKPRGIAADSQGNFYIADTGNSRVQKFDGDGQFVATFGTRGAAVGEMQAPSGIAIDEAGNIYITDSANHKLLKMGPDGHYLNEWTGTGLAFYGPRDIALGPNKQLYILDQGRNRIVKFDTVSETWTSWGSAGSAEGQFNETTGITTGEDLVFVAEPGNQRIQVFDQVGKFVRQWRVDAWDQGLEQYPDLVYDKQSKLLYVTNASTKDVIAFDTEGHPAGRLKLDAEESLNNPSNVCITEASGSRLLAVLDSGDSKVYLFDLSQIKQK
jgi:sugar lactone lactonase YvrE